DAIRADAEAETARKAGDQERAGRHEYSAASYRAIHTRYLAQEQTFATTMADRAEWERATEHSRHLAVAGDAELRRRDPTQDLSRITSVMSRKQIVSIAEANARINLWDGAIRSGKTIASLMRWPIYVASAPLEGELVVIGKTSQR